MDRLSYTLVICSAVLSGPTVAALAFGLRRGRIWCWCMAAIVLVGYVFGCVQRGGSAGFDYQIFRSVGLDVRSLLDPYAPDAFPRHLFFNPPTSLPLFALFAIGPLRVNAALWNATNAAIAATLVVLSVAALRAQRQLDPPGRTDTLDLPGHVVAALTAAVIASNANHRNLNVGQLASLTAALLIGMLTMQGRGRPILAGLLAALATIKVGTALPFLMAWNRRADWRTWAAAGIAVVALMVASGRPTLVPLQLATLLNYIGTYSRDGRVNDYTFRGTDHVAMIGFDHAFYRAITEDLRAVRTLQFATLLALMAGLAIESNRRSRLPRGATLSLLSLLSMVFLYHRMYDTVMLALPLTYALGRARSTRGRARALFAAAAIFCLVVMNVQSNLIWAIIAHTEGTAAWWAVRVAILPYATWSILAAMLCIWLAARQTHDAGADGVEFFPNDGPSAGGMRAPSSLVELPDER
jgi:hypothetical protein